MRRLHLPPPGPRRLAGWASALIGAALLVAAAPRVDLTHRSSLLPGTYGLEPAFPGAKEAGTLRAAGRVTDAINAVRQAKSTPLDAEATALRALLLGVLHAEAGAHDKALEQLAVAREPLPLLRDIVDLYLGRSLAKVGNTAQASEILRGVAADSLFHTVALREAVAIDLDQGATAQALVSIGALVGERPWEALDAPLLYLMGRTLEAGAGKGPADLKEAARAYQMVTLRYPLSREAGQAAQRLKTLGDKGIRPPPPSFDDRLAEARAYLNVHQNTEAITRFQALLDTLPEGEVVACRAALDQGRAYQKERRYEESLKPLQRVDRAECATEDRVIATFLQGRGYTRMGHESTALQVYAALVERWPDASMADDALMLSAAIHQDNNRHGDAEALLRRQLERYPDGDMAAEASWRLAWSAHSQGRTPEAIHLLETLLATGGELLLDDKLQATYWTAWWRASLGTSDLTRQQGRDQLEALAKEAPLHYYGLLAATRLGELAPERLAALSRPALLLDRRSPGPVDLAAEGPSIARAVALLTAGLRDLALKVLAHAELDALAPRERLAQGLLFDQLGLTNRAVGWTRGYITQQHLTQVLPDTLGWLVVGHPLPWAEHVHRFTEDNNFDPLLLWALMREESNFDPAIRSWAGASGLTQLMWPTAQETAKKLGIHVEKSTLTDAAVNIRLGAKYLGDLLKRYSGRATLAVPAYNGGAGSVNNWMKDRGTEPYDAWVEQIPFKQTRDYTKRVLGSYQTYHYLYRTEGSPWVEIKMKLQ